jgi:hypothetical protein
MLRMVANGRVDAAVVIEDNVKPILKIISVSKRSCSIDDDKMAYMK